MGLIQDIKCKFISHRERKLTKRLLALLRQVDGICRKEVLKNEAQARKLLVPVLQEGIALFEISDDFQNEDGTTSYREVTPADLPAMSTEKLLELSEFTIKELEKRV